MVAKDRRTSSETSKGEVGEIDTSAPFQSVKDAVTLFGEGAFSGDKQGIKKPRPNSAERYLAKETQLHLERKNLEKLSNQLKNAEAKKAQALAELEKSRITVEDLKQKLNNVTNSRNAAKAMANNIVKVIDVPKSNDLEMARKEYIAIFDELVAAKQELRMIYQERDASLSHKAAAIREADEADLVMEENNERIEDLRKEISDIQENVERERLASLQAQEQRRDALSEKDVQRQLYKDGLEDSSRRFKELSVEIGSEPVDILEKKLANVQTEIESLNRQMETAKTSDFDLKNSISSNIDDVKGKLYGVSEEEGRLRSLVESLKVELEIVKEENTVMAAKEADTESVADSLNVKLRKVKSDLGVAIEEESKAREASADLLMTLSQLSLEAEKARKEAEEMKIKAKEMKKEAESTRSAIREAEKTLTIALKEAEEAKTAEENALGQIKVLSEAANVARASTSESGAKITISREEYESLSRKVEESESLAEMKVAAAMANVEAIKASENEAVTRLEAMKEEIEDMRSEAEAALKQAEMAEAAKRAVEGELRRWREREEKRAAERASRILQDASGSSPRQFTLHPQNATSNRSIELHKMEKSRSSVAVKHLLPNITAIFNRKKSGMYTPAETAA